MPKGVYRASLPYGAYLFPYEMRTVYFQQFVTPLLALATIIIF